jgi:hypothetical protein
MRYTELGSVHASRRICPVWIQNASELFCFTKLNTVVIKADFFPHCFCTSSRIFPFSNPLISSSDHDWNQDRIRCSWRLERIIRRILLTGAWKINVCNKNVLLIDSLRYQQNKLCCYQFRLCLAIRVYSRTCLSFTACWWGALKNLCTVLAQAIYTTSLLEYKK